MIVDVYGKNLTETRQNKIMELMAKYGIDEEVEIRHYKSNRPDICIRGQVPLDLRFDMADLYKSL